MAETTEDFPLAQITEDGVYESARYPLDQNCMPIARLGARWYHRELNGALSETMPYGLGEGPYRRLVFKEGIWVPALFQHPIKP